MKKYFLFLIVLSLSTGVAYAQVQMEKFKPKKLERVEPERPRVLSIINVLSPNGGETWEKGKPYTIRWTSKGVKGNVKIMLKKIGGPWYTIAESVPNTGRYSYTVPKNIREGLKFLLYIMSSDEKVKDGSDKYFGITKREIRVLAPNGGEELPQGWDYSIRWTSSGRIGKVKILLEDERGVRHLLGKVPNTGGYNWRVSPKLRPEKYKLTIASLDDKTKDESDGRFEIIPPEVELTCGFLEYGKFTKKKHYPFYSEKTKYIRFEVFVQNNSRKFLKRVPFIWSILKQPLNDVVLQEEAGFGNVYPNRRYSTTYKYNIEKFEVAPFYWDKEKKWTKGVYSAVFEVDPRNELREPEWALENNKCEVTFSIE